MTTKAVAPNEEQGLRTKLLGLAKQRLLGSEGDLVPVCKEHDGECKCASYGDGTDKFQYPHYVKVSVVADTALPEGYKMVLDYPDAKVVKKKERLIIWEFTEGAMDDGWFFEPAGPIAIGPETAGGPKPKPKEFTQELQNGNSKLVLCCKNKNKARYSYTLFARNMNPTYPPLKFDPTISCDGEN
jgi:hypothetical protein